MIWGTVPSLVQRFYEGKHQPRYPDHGISVSTIGVPSTSTAIWTLRRASLYANEETQTIYCCYVYIYIFFTCQIDPARSKRWGKEEAMDPPPPSPRKKGDGELRGTPRLCVVLVLLLLICLVRLLPLLLLLLLPLLPLFSSRIGALLLVPWQVDCCVSLFCLMSPRAFCTLSAIPLFWFAVHGRTCRPPALRGWLLCVTGAVP